MLQGHSWNSLRIVCFLEFLILALVASACGRTKASLSPVSADVVMDIVHDYGREHQQPLSPPSPTKPDETDDKYEAHIRNLLFQEDFAQLETIAQQNRVEKGRLIGGYWKTYEFFVATGYPASSGELKDSDYQFQIAIVKKWIGAYPNSAAAHISLANLYGYYASFGRGPGFAESVSDAEWQSFNERTALAKQSLIEAARLKERDPEWYASMQRVAHHEGWDKPRARELLSQAVAFEPGYYHFYRLHAEYLLPQWHGQPGDIQAFAEEISSRLPEPDSSMVYFQIVSSLACYCRQATEALPHTSWPKIRQGYANLTGLYGTTNIIANRFAFMATTFKDKPSAHEGFSGIVSMEPGIWYTKEIFESSRDWATSP
jgi:hypothetical protein